MPSSRPARSPRGANADPRRPTPSIAELGSYIEDMARELEKLARGGGLERLGDLLKAAVGEARRAGRK